MAEAMKRLRAGLAEALAIYDGCAKTPDGEAGAQAGAVNAVDTVVTFLDDSGVPFDDQKPLLAILAAFRDHASGILAYVRSGLSNGRTEALNGKARTITRRAYGFHSARALIALLKLCCSGIHLSPVFHWPGSTH